MKRLPDVVLTPSALIAAFMVLSGCSVFSPVGDAISTGYESTVSYFNAYYNANRLFSEAETEIRTAALAARGKEEPSGQIVTIPATSKQKLTAVIDKCSNILAFHPNGNLVDDALFLIGKSFYYQGDYVRAERKFTELLVRYPTSNLALEAQMWFAQTLEKLNKVEDALNTSQMVMAAAQEKNERTLAVSARLEAARLYRKKQDDDQALETLRTALEHAANDEERARIRIFRGDILASNSQWLPAAEEYLKAAEAASDLYDISYSRLQAAVCKRQAARFGEARNILDAMMEDFRFKEYRGSIGFERGRTLAEEGRTAEAVDAYQYVDTTFARTEYGTRAAFELGRLYEQRLLDYSRARASYARAAAAPVPKLLADIRRKSNALDRYYDIRQKLHVVDSLSLVLADTLRPAPGDTTGKGVADSARVALMLARPSQYPLNADSLRAAKSRLQQDMGDIFYSELEVPDSAVTWYSKSLESAMDSLRTPRVLYILGEIARTYPDRGYVSKEDRYRELMTRFPSSDYAEAIRQSLGQSFGPSGGDPAAALYRQAETEIDSGHTEIAVQKLRVLLDTYPASSYAAKSQYAIAWLYEFRLANSDSALAWYRRVLQSQTGTPFVAPAVRKAGSIPAVRDTTAMSPAVVPRDTSRAVEAERPVQPPAPVVPAEKRPQTEPETRKAIRRERVD